jgi:predicted nucleic acid-binding protein
VKVLVDTSVWSLALRRKGAAGFSAEEQRLKQELAQAIQDGRVVMIGMIRQELLSGIKEPAQYEKIKAALDAFLDEPIDTADYEHAARLYNECRSHGCEAGPVDMLICAVAVRRSWGVLSSDEALNRCLAITRKFDEKQRALRKGTG